MDIEYINKYDNRLSIGLCLEENNNGIFICNNKIIPGDDFCKEHSYESQTIDSEGYIKDEQVYKKYISNLLYYDNLYLINIENNLDKNSKYREKEIFYNNKYKKDNISFKFFEEGSIRYTWYEGKIRGETRRKGNPFQCDDCNKIENIYDYKIGSLVEFYCRECAMENVKSFIEFNKRFNKIENYN